jgi:hypothetical protein
VSLFKTILPVDVKQILDSLPKDYFLHGITFDKATREVCILWEHEKLESGLTVPVEFKVVDLTKKLLPDGVRNLDKVTKQKTIKPKADIKPVPTPALPPAIPLIRTQAEYDAAMAHGEDLEYQGITPIWNPVDARHVFTAGYFYRKAIRK